MALGFRVKINGGALSNVITDVGNVNNHTFTGLDYGVNYDISVQKYNDSGDSAFCTPLTKSCPTPPSNVALAAAGSTVTVTSVSDAVGTPGSALIDGERTGGSAYLTGGKNWVSLADPATTPQRAEVTFSGSKSVSEIDVISSPASFGAEPTCSGPTIPYGSDHAVKDYKIQYWNGSTWVDIATITGNTDWWRKHIFSPVTTTKIAIEVTASTGSLAKAYLAELEAWETGKNPVVIVNEGDSRIQSSSVNAELQRLLNHNYCAQAIATSGDKVQLMVSGGQVATEAVPLYNAHAVANIYINSAGVNDFGSGRTAAQVMADYVTLYGQARAAGFLILACTTAPAFSIGDIPELDAFNVLLRTNPSGLWDGLCDLAADPSLADPADTVFYIDGVHWTSLGATVAANLMNDAVRLMAPF